MYSYIKIKSSPLIKLYYYIIQVQIDKVLTKLIFLKVEVSYRKGLINLIKAY